MITIEQLKETTERVEALNRYLDIDAKMIEHEEELLRTQDPGFWDDAKRAEEQMKKVKGLEKWIKGYREVKTLADELSPECSIRFRKSEPGPLPAAFRAAGGRTPELSPPALLTGRTI
jgi:peptide chain release factor 2